MNCKTAPFNAVLDVEFSEEGDEFVTLTEAKDHCRISNDITEDNAEVTRLITVARIMCEKFSNTSLIERTVTAVLNNSCGNQFLPYGPLADPTEVEYKDIDGNDVTGCILKGIKFCSLYLPLTDYIKLTYNSGFYNADTAYLPENYKQAILCQVKYLYDNRGDEKATLSEMTKVLLKQAMR